MNSRAMSEIASLGFEFSWGIAFLIFHKSISMPIPFEKKLFLKIWVIVLAATALVFVGAVLFFDYELTTADPICSPIAAALLAYFLHLMFYNPETAERKD